MTIIHRCLLELHDSVYYATREIGRLYETEPVIHNYALCYALRLVDSDRYATCVAEEHSYRYFCAEQVPKYEEHLTPLNQQGIYITPARSLSHAAILNTWKYADNRYHAEMEKTQKNIPSFGRTKEIAPESQFEFFALSDKPLRLPRWIRLGKWMSKAEVEIVETQEVRRSTTEKEFIFPYPLNPLDVMFSHQVIRYDVINMPPVSLIQNVKLRGQYYEFDKLKIPVGMQYCFRS
jgi:CRISPR-associated protein Csc1